MLGTPDVTHLQLKFDLTIEKISNFTNSFITVDQCFRSTSSSSNDEYIG